MQADHRQADKQAFQTIGITKPPLDTPKLVEMQRKLLPRGACPKGQDLHTFPSLIHSPHCAEFIVSLTEPGREGSI